MLRQNIPGEVLIMSSNVRSQVWMYIINNDIEISGRCTRIRSEKHDGEIF